MPRFPDEVRMVLHDLTNEWHLESGREMMARFEMLRSDEQDDARYQLDVAKRAFRNIHKLIYKMRP